ncbi:MAG TPA: indolepyruvate ferredoxin oxidoreductase subunit alpha [Actinobacteria bacterium]|nr:indolepyruvate ferredoxin oxidoreductase subunit alpha [Actinomycetota bacterium]
MTLLVEADRALLSGNEAIARGAWEAGVVVASAYPGTPSTETLEAMAAYPEVDARWATNEKVAVDVALGASLGGVRALAVMKHVGLNVAADTFMSATSTGVGAGLVIMVADDPGMHSSQNEQDTRFYARFGLVPLLEPSDSAEAKEFTKLAFEVSERFDTPVLLRSTTRISHNRGIVELGPRGEVPVRGFQRNPHKYVMLPAYARDRHPWVLERLERLTDYAAELAVEEGDDPKVGIVTAGVPYQYVKEVYPDAHLLKLGMSFPIPIERIRRFADAVERLIVVEELEPFLEEQLRAAGIEVVGKDLFPRVGELSPDLVHDGLAKAGILEPREPGPAPPTTVARPPLLCAGCPHMVPYWALKRLGATVTGDIGCYTLAALDPIATMDTCVAMGSSIGMASGLAASGGSDAPVVATIGDSTFLHGGVPALMEAVYNQANITVVILDNGTVAMTGGQEHPGSGTTLKGEETRPVDIPALCRAVGVEDVHVVDPYDVPATMRAFEEAIAHRGPSVVITYRPCIEAPVRIKDRPYEVVAADCTACQLCMNLGCPAIIWTDETFEGRRKVTIDPTLCTGCTLCAQLCPPRAIVPVEVEA